MIIWFGFSSIPSYGYDDNMVVPIESRFDRSFMIHGSSEASVITDLSMVCL